MGRRREKDDGERWGRERLIFHAVFKLYDEVSCCCNSLANGIQGELMDPAACPTRVTNLTEVDLLESSRSW